MSKEVLVGFEESQAVCKEFRKLGFAGLVYKKENGAIVLFIIIISLISCVL